jgi:hypothetical protein
VVGRRHSLPHGLLCGRWRRLEQHVPPEEAASAGSEPTGGCKGRACCRRRCCCIKAQWQPCWCRRTWAHDVIWNVILEAFYQIARRQFRKFAVRLALSGLLHPFLLLTQYQLATAGTPEPLASSCSHVGSWGGKPAAFKRAQAVVGQHCGTTADVPRP